MKPSYFVLLFALLYMCSCQPTASDISQPEFKKHYDSFQVEGSFVLYDPQKKQHLFYNQAQASEAFIPASTFKICNTLIGLETGIISDEHFALPWDSIFRNPVWDQDHDLPKAFANSTVWFYQEIARRIGAEKMQHWLSKANYGNADMSGGIDKFWLTGALRITPLQQIEFLEKLHNNTLPFSQRAMEITKSIMVIKDTTDYTLFGKSGWSNMDNKDIGWFIGFVKKKEQVYFFSNCVQTESARIETDQQHAINFDQSRRKIVYQILNELAIIPNNSITPPSSGQAQ
jgi:beta-lactamase class D